ncbi:MAG: hypothetical protein P4L28_03580 [Paludibacteraceae bacterium]|nr:hypothetical protein [Paludibacteraceae bacterium]
MRFSKITDFPKCTDFSTYLFINKTLAMAAPRVPTFGKKAYICVINKVLN